MSLRQRTTTAAQPLVAGSDTATTAQPLETGSDTTTITQPPAAGSNTTTTADGTAPAPIASCVADANVLIVGGGPVGSFAAALLHAHGVRTTVLERLPEDHSFDVSRTYTFALNLRGQHVLGAIPHLLPSLTTMAASDVPYRMGFVDMEGKCVCPDMNKILPGHKPSLLFLRPRLVEALQRFAKEQCSLATFVHDATVTGANFGESGAMSVAYEVGKEKREIETRLVLACDGANSVIVRQLRIAAEQSTTADRPATTDQSITADRPAIPAPALSSSHGFGADVGTSRAVGLKVRAMVWSRAAYDGLQDAPDGFSTHWLRIKGRSLSMGILPMNDTDIDVCGGVLAYVSSPPEHPVWQLTDVDEALTFFENNFPQLAVREIMTPDSVRRFLDASQLIFPSVSRTHSLVAAVGTADAVAAGDGGAVAILGDAAHVMPPDIGQGLNSGLEDVAELVRTFVQAASTDAKLPDVLRAFEATRMPDIVGLCELACFAGQGTANMGRVSRALRIIDQVSRVKMSGWFPSLFYPSTTAMFAKGWPYGVIRQRYRQTTRRLLAVGALCATSVVFVGLRVCSKISPEKD